MKLKVVIHKAAEGGCWAEAPAIPGCATQGEYLLELIENVYDAVDACLSVDAACWQNTALDIKCQLG